MKIVRQRILPAIAVMLASCVMRAATNPFAHDPQAGEAGRLVFRIYCSPCHGIRGEGGSRGPALTAGHYSVGDSDDALFTVIHDGVHGTGMAAFGGRVIDDNIWRIVSYLRLLSAHDNATAQGNSANGEKLFWGRGGCGECHTIGGKGGKVGPNLTRVGKQRSLAYMKKVILDPNANPSRRTSVTLVTNSGLKITGTARGIDNFTVRMVDANGDFHSFLKDDLASVTQETKSTMPDVYGRLFTTVELDDLLSYLATLTGDSKP
jgi:putative heme-binding domain-containing protein